MGPTLNGVLIRRDQDRHREEQCQERPQEKPTDTLMSHFQPPELRTTDVCGVSCPVMAAPTDLRGKEVCPVTEQQLSRDLPTVVRLPL